MHAGAFGGEQIRPEPAEGLDLVEDQQGASVVASLPELNEVASSRRSRQAVGDHRRIQDGGSEVSTGPHQPHQRANTGFGGPYCDGVIGDQAPGVGARQAESQMGFAVPGAGQAGDVLATGVQHRQFDRGLDRVGPISELERDSVEPFGGKVGDAAGQQNERQAREPRRGKRYLLGLRSNSLGYSRMTVSQREVQRLRRQVNEPTTVGDGEMRAACVHDRRPMWM